MSTSSAPARVYHVVTAVWGAEFIDLFLNVCVPNQLSPRNLAALPVGSRYRVFTRASDVSVLRDSPRLEEVRAIVPVDIVEVDASEFETAKGGQNRYKLMTACHRRAAADAAEVEAALIFLSPDFVLSEGTLDRLVRIHAAGSRAVLAANLRLSRSEFIAAVSGPGAARALAPRELVRRALPYLHPATKSLMVDGSNRNDFPTAVYWPVRSATGALDGIFLRSLHLHPLLLDPVRRDVLPRHTIDGQYVMDCCPDVDQHHIVDDSDEIVAFELTPAETVIGNDTRRRGVSHLRLAAVAATCNAHQLSYFQHPIRLHAEDFDERWTSVEVESSVCVRQLERYRPAGRLLIRVYRWRKIWRRRTEARVRAMRRTVRDNGRALRRMRRRTMHRRHAYERAMRTAVRSRSSLKRLARPVNVWSHHAIKNCKLALKRIRRRVRLLLPA